MAKNKSTQSTEETALENEQIEGSESVVAEPSQPVAEEVAEEVKPVEEAEPSEPPASPLEPAVVELQTSKDEAVKPARSQEEIAAAMHEKLSRKTDQEGQDPFVPSSQLENEVKQIANKNGFPLSRGTEIGARLMARSKRVVI